MKQIFLFIAIFLTLTISGNAQNLVDTNNIWSVVYLNESDNQLFVYQFDGDTTIGVNQYIKLYKSDSTNSFLSYVGAMREDLKKVYFHRQQNEFLYYDFNLNPGDTFTTTSYIFSPTSGCDIQLKVDSIDYITLLNNESRKRFYFSAFPPNEQWKEQWIEGIGSINGPSEMETYLCIYSRFPKLNCFTEKNILKFKNLNFNSCFSTTNDVPEVHKPTAWTANPNPFTEFTILSFQNPERQNLTLTVYSITGQLVIKTTNITDSQISIERGNLENGLYFFRLMNERILIAKGKLIIEK